VTGVTHAGAQSPPPALLDEALRALEPAFRLDNLVAMSPDRALYQAWDRVLKRYVGIRLHLTPGTPSRAWFMRETETLAALDHPTIRHAYAASRSGCSPIARPTGSGRVCHALRRGPAHPAMPVARPGLLSA
jgi:hypothetical protein